MSKQPSRGRATFAAVLGTITEYYDYSLYGFSSVYLAKAFFPAADEITSIVITFGVLSVGYLSKPLGGFIFGYLGDKFGRRMALNITVAGIAIPTCAIGLAPTYEQVGLVAPILITLCRFAQGIFVGGQYDGAAIYLLEHNGSAKSGYASALMRSASVAGLLLGALMIGICTEISDTLWRLPFCFSIILMFITFYFRREMLETPEFVEYFELKKKKLAADISFADLLRQHWRRMVLAALLFGCFSGCVQFLIVFMKSFLPQILPISKTENNILHFLTIVVLGISMLCTAFSADRIGIERLIRYAFIACFAATAVLVTGFLQNDLRIIVVGQLLLTFTIAPTNALMHGLVYRLFDVGSRYRAVSVSHNIGSMLLSGSTAFISALIFKYTGHSFLPVAYLLLLFSCAFFLSKVV